MEGASLIPALPIKYHARMETGSSAIRRATLAAVAIEEPALRGTTV
jgi:hypothetical protein